ncbi:MAG: sulfatase-like hydrolase/transferase [Acholeplasmataceae bacterium]|nr:sulfatase-like hydrolase/transferase [Acholeplasmataceae bacterium]
MLVLIFVSLVLNAWVFLLSIFNLYFGTAFSNVAFSIFKNPAGGLASGIIKEMFLELFLYYRIILFLPTIVLLVVFLLSDRRQLKLTTYPFKLKRLLVSFFSVILIVVVSIFSYYDQYRKTLPLIGVKSTFAIQNFGVYPFYAAQFLGFDLDINISKMLDIETTEDIAEAYQVYNKNQENYINFFDQNTYGNRLSVLDAVDTLIIDPQLSTSDSLHGILEGKNLVLVHFESFNYFLLQIPEINDRLTFFNQLLDQSFVMHNFYTNVGMGVSADSELSVLTGLYPIGDSNLYWEYNKRPYELNTLIKYYNQKGYATHAIHGDTELFYNRRVVYANMMAFDAFYSLENFVEEGYVISEGYMYDNQNELIHHSPWISDYHLAEKIDEFGNQYMDQSQPFVLFPVTMMPHTPFEYDPNGHRVDIYPQWIGQISALTLKYLNYMDYFEDTMKRYFISENLENRTLENTVYLFYSDHGSGLKNGDVSILLDKQMTLMEDRQALQHTLAFLYVPGEEMIDYGDYQIRKGLLTGDQYKVRSLVDLYRSTIELFNLPAGKDSYFGTHIMSKEPTFAIDNRLMDVVTDAYFYSMRNPSHIFPEDMIVNREVYEYILRFKLLGDLIFSSKTFQKQVDEAILIVYGS